MSQLVIHSGTCITPMEVIKNSSILIEDGTIKQVDQGTKDSVTENSHLIDASGMYVIPGMIDVHVNGGKGANILDGTDQALQTMAEFHLKHGTTSMVPTIISSSTNKMIRALNLVETAMNTPQSFKPKILGAHLEGPYISKAQKGAHNPAHIRSATPGDYQPLLDYVSTIRMVTAAPEISGVLKFAQLLKKHDIILSIGHSNATYPQVVSSVEAGFSLVTHIYSVMSSIRRKDLTRIPGVVESGLLLDELSVEVIGDNLHLPGSLIELIVKTKGIDKVILVTDAIRAAGMPDGTYYIGDINDNHSIVVEDGVAKTSDRQLLAGSTATMDICLNTLVSEAGLPLKDAVKTATLNPARLLGIENEYGIIASGKKADVVILDQDYRVQTVIVNGKIEYEYTNQKKGR